MQRNILIAVDESESSMKAVDLVAETFAAACRVALLGILRPVDLLCEMEASALKGFLATHHPDYCREVDAHREDALQAALSAARQRLIDAGFSENHVTPMLKTMRTDVALEIVEESRKGYDVIVLGRRGLSPVKGFFLGSVSQKVLSIAKEVSVLIVN